MAETNGVIMKRAFVVLLCAALNLSAAAAYAQSAVRDVTDPARVAERTAALQKDLIDLGIAAKLQCSQMIEEPKDSEGKSLRYGAMCDITVGDKAPRMMMLCNDTMIGTLTVKAYGFSETRDELAAFTANNC